MKKIISVLLVLLMTASFAVSVSAQKDLLEWSFSEDDAILTDSVGREYTYYRIPYVDTFYPKKAYVYEYALVNKELQSCDVMMSDTTGDIVSVLLSSSWEVDEIYVTEYGKSILDAFYGGMYGYARIYDYSDYFSGTYYEGYGDITIDFLEELDSFEGETVSFDVRDLENADSCLVYVYDSTDSMEHLHGEIYIVDEEYYYVNYDALDNSYFDSDGFFSFRSGTVSALKLDDGHKSVLSEAAENLYMRDPVYEYVNEEEEFFEMEVDDGASLPIFWIISVIVGFVTPLCIGIVGICLALSKRTGKSKRWLVLTGLSVLWMLISTAIILVIII